MVRRERNHPSVIMWSIGNEIAEQDGPELAQHLRDIVHAEDPTRPVTAGCNNPAAGTNGFQTAVDVFGLNYNLRVYRPDSGPSRQRAEARVHLGIVVVHQLAGRVLLPDQARQGLRGQLPGLVL